MTTFLASCAVLELKMPELPDVSQELGSMLQSEKRAEYKGSDSVAKVDPSTMIGTWKVEIINSVELENELDMQISFNEDNTINAIIAAELAAPIGKFAYDMKGT